MELGAGMSAITIHRFVEPDRRTEGDLSMEDLGRIWAQLKAERLVEVFFRAGTVRSYYDFLRYVRLSDCWFYAVKRDSEYIALGAVNGFSDTGNTAYAHFVAFKAGRSKDFFLAADMWFYTLANAGGLDTLIAVLPACYRAAITWAAKLGFAERMRLPSALRVVRGEKDRAVDAVVMTKDLLGLKKRKHMEASL